MKPRVKTTWRCIVKRATGLSIRAICALSPSDRVTLAMARRTVLRNKPRAIRHLDHYLVGCGKDLSVETSQLFAEDRGVLGAFSRAVSRALHGGSAHGCVAIPQDAYANEDWRYTLGGIELLWRIEGGEVETWFKDRYRWKPGERRVTQAVHRAAESLKGLGAREFNAVGRVYRVQKGYVMHAAATMSRACRDKLLL